MSRTVYIGHVVNNIHTTFGKSRLCCVVGGGFALGCVVLCNVLYYLLFTKN